VTVFINYGIDLPTLDLFGSFHVVRPVWIGGSVAKLYPQPCRDMIMVGLSTERSTVVDFKGSHFEREIVLWGVRWYVAYPISYRQLEEMMEERGVEVDHSRLNCWVLTYAPLLDQAFRARKRRVGGSWRMDETDVRIRGQWKYLDRPSTRQGTQSISCWLRRGIASQPRASCARRSACMVRRRRLLSTRVAPRLRRSRATTSSRTQRLSSGRSSTSTTLSNRTIARSSVKCDR